MFDIFRQFQNIDENHDSLFSFIFVLCISFHIFYFISYTSFHPFCIISIISHTSSNIFLILSIISCTVFRAIHWIPLISYSSFHTFHLISLTWYMSLHALHSICSISYFYSTRDMGPLICFSNMTPWRHMTSSREGCRQKIKTSMSRDNLKWSMSSEDWHLGGTWPSQEEHCQKAGTSLSRATIHTTHF